MDKCSRYLEAFLDISYDLTTTTDIQRLYRKVVGTARQLLGFDFSTLMLLTEDGSRLLIKDTLGFPDAMIGTFALLKGQGLATHVVARKAPALVADFDTEQRFEVPQVVVDLGIRSALSVPMMLEDAVFGALIGHTLAPREFTREEINLFELFGNQAAAAIKNAQHVEALRTSESRFRALFNSISDGVYICGRNGDLLEVNQAGCDRLGFGRKELLAKKVFDIVDADPRLIASQMKQMLSRGELVFEWDLRRRDGTTFPVELSGRTIEFDGEQAFLGIARDITERKRSEEEISRLAYLDTLTGLPNRLLLLDRLNQKLEQGVRTGENVGVLFLDLDRFKNVNDTFGHSYGDELLKQVADRLKTCVRKSDTLARLGGDEFVVVLGRLAQENDAVRVAQKILETLRSPFDVGGHEVFCTASIGMTLFPHDGSDEETLLKNADLAMYWAKDRGRNSCQFFSPEMNEKVALRLQMETRLRQALERGELTLCYQPQVNFESGSIVGVEALLRWRNPELGQIPPSRFIPLAEETGLIGAIGEWVLRTACTQCRDWQLKGAPSLRMAVNISGVQFRQDNLVETVRNVLADTALPPQSLELELTESSLLNHQEEIQAVVGPLKELGLRFAIDDFGTGHASLGLLKHYPIDRLKIARPFIRDVCSDPGDVAIIEAVIALSRSLGLQVIAEGVETAEQRDLLLARHCFEMQGFLFSRPLPPEELEPLLGKRFAVSP